MKKVLLCVCMCVYLFVKCVICDENSQTVDEDELVSLNYELLPDDNEIISKESQVESGNEVEKTSEENEIKRDDFTTVESSSGENPSTITDNNKLQVSSISSTESFQTVKTTDGGVKGTTKSPVRSKKLLLVQLVFRHGDRSPAFKYKTNPNPPWEEGLGMLTKLGRKQHYALGRYLHEMYKNFSTYSPNEIVVVSTAYDRAMRSAASHVASLFAPPEEWKIAEDLNWQPIPIHYLPMNQDRVLLPSPSCPRAEEEYRKTLNSPEGQKFMAEHTDTFQKLSAFSGENDLDIIMATLVFDNIQVDKKYNRSVPDWIEPFWDEMTNVTDYVYYWFFKSPVQRRLRAGPLVERILDNANKKIGGELPQLKFQVYSAHDMTVASALVGFNVFNNKQPPFCATVVFELHEMTDGSNALRILYLNSTEPESKIDDPHVFTIEGCSEYCPLDYVVNSVNETIPTNWEKECILNL